MPTPQQLLQSMQKPTTGEGKESLRSLLSSYGPSRYDVPLPEVSHREGATQTQEATDKTFKLDAEKQRLVDLGYLKLNEPIYHEARAQGEGGTEIAPYWEYSLTPTDKAPKTLFGSDQTKIRAYDIPSGRGGGGMIDKTLWYNDPNYGPITPRANTIDPSSERDWRDFAGPALMGLITMGAGYLPAAGFGAMGAAGTAAGAAGAMQTGAAMGLSGMDAMLGGAAVTGWGMPAAATGFRVAKGVVDTARSRGRNAGGLLGGLIGGYSGVPFGSRVGSMFGNLGTSMIGGQRQPQYTPQQLAMMRMIAARRG